MNLILLSAEDFVDERRVVLRDRRKDHILNVHRARPGDRLRVGEIDGLLGAGRLLHCSAERAELEVELRRSAPPARPVTLVLALPRPKMLKRILQAVAALGIKNIYLINSYRVDKSFWGSPLLQPERLREQLLLGLEQAGDTVVPQIQLRQRFKPFVEDELPGIVRDGSAYVAHPEAEMNCPTAAGRKITAAVGPEGGFIPYEIEKFTTCGFTPVALGERILRVETAVPVIIGRLSV